MENSNSHRLFLGSSPFIPTKRTKLWKSRISSKKALLDIAASLEEASDETGGQQRFRLTNVKLWDKGQDNGLIEFDLAVTVSQSKQHTKGGRLKIAVVEAKADAEQQTSTSSISRIKFVVEDMHS